MGGDHTWKGDLLAESEALRGELDELQPVVSAAVLVATAFRMRDHEALITALSMLTRAIRQLEQRRLPSAA